MSEKKNKPKLITVKDDSSLDEKITITRKELALFVNAYGYKVQAYEAGQAWVEMQDAPICEVKRDLLERSLRHKYCAEVMADALPPALRSIVKNHSSHSVSALKEAAAR